jgi:hypothetical protein
LPETKKEKLLEFGFIQEADSEYKASKLIGKYLDKFLDNLREFKKQLVPKILTEEEFGILIRRASNGPFDVVWERRFKLTHGKGYFQTEKNESIYSKFSSRGWKIHIVFPKGKEKVVARFLYEHGFYFKIETGMGTFFNGNISSGATIYIGSWDDMVSIAGLIEKGIGRILMQGSFVEVGNKRMSMGSGSDVEIMPNITARFDVYKTRFGLAGTKKYFEHGLPTWSGLGGIPILNKYSQQVSEFQGKWNSYNENQRRYVLDFFRRVYNESKIELIKDFGSEFVFGKKK